jgi:hypothetical protein
MHKGGIGVVANASAMERQRRVSQAGGAHARDANINRHCLRVQTMSRNVVSVSPQKFIAPRRAVAGNDIDFIVGDARVSSQYREADQTAADRNGVRLRSANLSDIHRDE